MRRGRPPRRERGAAVAEGTGAGLLQLREELRPDPVSSPGASAGAVPPSDCVQIQGSWKVIGVQPQKTGLYEYKVFGVLEDCSPTLLADVYMDLDYRKQWDQYVKELYEQECNGQTVVYWEVKYPFPMSNRDYVYLRQRRDLDVEGRKIHVVLAQSTSVPQLVERSGVIRVKQYKQSLAIESDGKKGSKVFMYYFDNPGGQIPSWLINWAAKSYTQAARVL
ncbi:phosphatidylcholine transfer protein isoform X3 [Macaca thibetana thibetana]|uniref:phosphatidylcholine transfer protein isoform X3 n=1 Tax=Macaca thibetana thibetana TaxID=257877 RepID=UPI0021BC5176|nr:phosphatidylcholine transfer protein isoform X3 [Macaca thibetana thibetana]